jgi:hypothetical protein
VKANPGLLSRWAQRIGFYALLVLAPGAQSQTLYDATVGTVPGGQGWVFAKIGGATETLTNGAVALDTTAATGGYAGYSRLAATSLDHVHGFTLLFSARLDAETHVKTDRAGFSVIVLAEDKRGIELGFWTNLVFAQGDSPLFVHAEEAPYDTASAFADYALSILATYYILRANGSPLLSGPVRDYTSFQGVINPYSTPNFIFLGDDTSSASAACRLRKIVLVTAPTLTFRNEGLLCWQGVSNQTYLVQSSTNLSDWATLGAAVSPTVDFCFTNTPLQPQQFFRLLSP